MLQTWYAHIENTENSVRPKVKIMSSAYKCSRADWPKAVVDREGHVEKGEFEVDHREINQFT